MLAFLAFSIASFAQSVAPALPLVATRPTIVASPQPDVTNARKLGHHGKVMARATITVDGTLRDIEVEQSSKSPLLDAAVKQALLTWKLRPAIDAEGRPVEYPAKLSFEFNGDIKQGWLARYDCGSFTRDMNWWRSVNPGVPDSEHEQYKMVAGARVLADPNNPLGRPLSGTFVAGNPNAGTAMQKTAELQDKEWRKAVERCKTATDELFIDQFSVSGVLKAFAKPKTQ